LQAFRTAASVAHDRAVWERMLQKLRTGAMPPPGASRPAPAELKAVTSWIEAEFDRVDQSSPTDPGRVTARRLHRAEDNNTVRDLTGVDLRPADDFPQDDSGYGFDNIGDVLSLSPVLMEKYLAAAERVARAAVFGQEQTKPTMVKLRSSGQRMIPSLTPLFD